MINFRIVRPMNETVKRHRGGIAARFMVALMPDLTTAAQARRQRRDAKAFSHLRDVGAIRRRQAEGAAR